MRHVKYGAATLYVVRHPECYLAAFLGGLLRRCCLILLAAEDTLSTDMVSSNTAPLPEGSGGGPSAEK